MRTLTYWLSLLMIFMIPWEGLSVVSGLGTISRLVGMVVIVFWLATIIIENKVRQIVPFHLLVFLFFLWNMASYFWSLDTSVSFKRILTYIRMIGLILIIWNLYVTPTAVKTAIQTYVLGTFAPIFAIINNYITGNVAGFEQRVSISGNNANTSGFIIAIVIPLACYLAFSANTDKRARILRLANFAFIPLAVFAIALTGTRFAMIMAIPSIIFGVWSIGRLKHQTRILAIIALSGVLLYVSSIVPQANIERLSTADDEIAAGDLNGRTALWKNGYDLWIDRPLLGIGSATFPSAVEPIYGRPRSAHNSYVAVLTETGVIGFVLYGMVLGMAMFIARQLPKWESALWLTIITILGLGNLVMTWTYVKSTWLLLSLLVVHVYALHQQHAATLSPKFPASQRAHRFPQLGLTIK